MGSRPRLHGSRLCAGITEGSGRLGGVLRRAATRVAPTDRGEGARMGSRPRLHGGRLCVGITEGSGRLGCDLRWAATRAAPTDRGAKEGGGVPAPVFMGRALRGNSGRGAGG